MIPNLIVPVLNRYDLLDRMLESLDHEIGELLIIDNGGAYLETHGSPVIDCANWVTVLSMPGNLGVAGSWNLGIKTLYRDDRWFFASNDVVFEPGSLEILSQARTDQLTLVSDPPFWQTFVVGEKVVEWVGLFDEAFMPAYYEDNDYMWRVESSGFQIKKLEVPLTHDNSSTLKSDPGFQEANRRSFRSNRDYYRGKRDGSIAVKDQGWRLSRTRLNAWD